MGSPFISVAMTSYNGEKYILEQLNSLLIQTKSIHEVVIVDDCSSDNTVNIIEKFIKEHALQKTWQLYKSEKNQGFIETFNKSISLTSGDIIFLADQDDVWEKNKVQKMSELMSEPKILSLNSSFQKINQEGHSIKNYKDNIVGTNYGLVNKKIKINDSIIIPIKDVINYNISPGCTMAFKKEVKEIFVEKNICSIEMPHDWKINIIAAYLNGLYFFNCQTIKYRLHENNTIGLNRSFSSSIRSKKCHEFAIEKGNIKVLIQELNEIYPEFEDLNYEIIADISNLESFHYKRSKLIENNNLLKLCELVILNRKEFKRNFKNILVDIATILNSKIKKV